MAEKSSPGAMQRDGKNWVGYEEMERKLAKLSIPTFTYRSSSLLFYGCASHSPSAEGYWSLITDLPPSSRAMNSQPC
jgi:hypothetical protein